MSGINGEEQEGNRGETTRTPFDALIDDLNADETIDAVDGAGIRNALNQASQVACPRCGAAAEGMCRPAPGDDERPYHLRDFPSSTCPTCFAEGFRDCSELIRTTPVHAERFNLARSRQEYAAERAKNDEMWQYLIVAAAVAAVALYLFASVFGNGDAEDDNIRRDCDMIVMNDCI